MNGENSPQHTNEEGDALGSRLRVDQPKPTKTKKSEVASRSSQAPSVKNISHKDQIKPKTIAQTKDQKIENQRSPKKDPIFKSEKLTVAKKASGRESPKNSSKVKPAKKSQAQSKVDT